jgi:hypothetical protein
LRAYWAGEEWDGGPSNSPERLRAPRDPQAWLKLLKLLTDTCMPAAGSMRPCHGRVAAALGATRARSTRRDDRTRLPAAPLAASHTSANCPSPSFRFTTHSLGSPEPLGAAGMRAPCSVGRFILGGSRPEHPSGVCPYYPSLLVGLCSSRLAVTQWARRLVCVCV